MSTELDRSARGRAPRTGAPRRDRDDPARPTARRRGPGAGRRGGRLPLRRPSRRRRARRRPLADGARARGRGLGRGRRPRRHPRRAGRSRRVLLRAVVRPLPAVPRWTDDPLRDRGREHGARHADGRHLAAARLCGRHAAARADGRVLRRALRDRRGVRRADSRRTAALAGGAARLRGRDRGRGGAQRRPGPDRRDRLRHRVRRGGPAGDRRARAVGRLADHRRRSRRRRSSSSHVPVARPTGCSRARTRRARYGG